MADTTAQELYGHLVTASKMVNRFRQEVGREMTEHDRTIAITLFLQAHPKGNGNGAAPKANGGGQRQQSNGSVPSCPQCGGPMHDNRGDKKNPKAPDFRCKDTDCLDENGYRTGLWERDVKQQKATAAATPQRQQQQGSPFEDEFEELPF